MTTTGENTRHQHDHGHAHDHAHDHGQSPVVERRCDVAVVGGSAAGLAAALQLARQRRSVLVVDDGTPRNAPAAHMHGYLGREGAAPSELLAVGREEVRSYGGEVLAGRVLAVHRLDEGGFRVELTGGHTLLARRVVAATGITDELPDIEGLAEHWGRDVVHCPFCHGYEVRDARLVQVVTHPMGLHPTAVLRHLTGRLTVVLDGRDADPDAFDPQALATLEAAGTPVVRGSVRRVVGGPDGRLTGVELADGEVLAADAVLVGARFRARVDVLAPAGVTATAHPTGFGDVLEVDARGETAVPGVYAAGNVTDPSLQVLPSAAHGSRVAAMVAFDLAEEDLRAGFRASGAQVDWDHRYGGAEPVWSANPNGTLVAEAAGLPVGRALDVGAGEGADALWLAEHGWTVTASDVSGNALARVGAEAGRRGLDVRLLRADAGEAGAFGAETYDLVSLQYGSFHRSPDGLGVANLLGAVAPGGTLLVVAHDLTPLTEPLDVAEQTRMWDPAAYVGVEELAAALDRDEWDVDGPATRPRPPGAVSGHHVHDVVLRATRRR
ncbi:bifunctional NAD(P)/FAD-dependent oxidoreductase/class I SAM-dependent methyltransferase [Aquipuribacter sp. SD81]|uniref:bifunctional NAD(P)/FAD-dependent oxidoreductase/class I SAM-dependent methyltransferase n=1 Tax=Aquipuribacter sp. SD81 TaxID=3127703 RepID=UPI0030199D54